MTKTVFVRADFNRQAIAKAKEKLNMPHGRVVEVKYVKQGQWKVILS